MIILHLCRRWVQHGFRLRAARLRPACRPLLVAFRPTIDALESRLVPSSFTVTGLGDNGAGSGYVGDLRYCVNAANTNGEASNRIVFQDGLAGTITLAQGELDVTKSLEIDGPGESLLTISGNHESGVFALTSDPRLEDFRLADLMVADGTGVLDPFFGNFHAGGGLYDYSASADVTLTRCTFAGNGVTGPTDFGGAIAKTFGTLVIDSCTLTGNRAGDSGGAIAVIGNQARASLTNDTISGNTAPRDSAIFNLGTLTLDDCTVADNVASSSPFEGGDTILNGGGGTLTMTDSRIEGNAGSVPCIFNLASRMVITDSTVADNVGGGGLSNYGSMTISGTTISGNVDLHNYAGGIYAFDVGTGSDLEVVNSTLSGNSSTQVGGIRLVFQRQSLELTSSTITRNSGVFSGGLAVFQNISTGEAARALVRNSIIAGNDGGFPDVSGPVVSVGYNLVGQTDGSSGWGATDLTGTSHFPLDPQLSPLQDNGGPTLTQAPAFTSPAHGHGDSSLFGSFDQRGTPRGNLVGPPDIGAVSAAQAIHLAVLAPDEVVSGEPFDLTVVALDNWGNRAYAYQDTVHFSSSDPAAQLPANYGFGPDDWGAQSFSVRLGTVGTQSIQVADTGGFPSGSALVDVQEGDSPGTGAGGSAWTDLLGENTFVQPRRTPSHALSAGKL